MCDLSKKSNNREDKNNLLLATNSEGNTVWHFAAQKSETVTIRQI
jgi:hypothetical protein